MTRPWVLGRGALLGVALLSLFLLGSPGCGCGDDELRPPSSGQPEQCCCIFQWLPPPNVAFRDVVITVENEDPSLHAVVTPSLLLGVIGREFETFTVCVNDDHVLGASLELVFTDNVSAVEYGRAQLFYDVRCNPGIEPLTPEMNLVSTDCGGETLQCCCLFEWLPSTGQSGDVTLSLENQGASLNGTISPSTLLGVAPNELENFTVCVDADHALGETMRLVVRQQGSGVELGGTTLEYNERCIPTVVPDPLAVTLRVTSVECGGPGLECCCDVEWVQGDPDFNTTNITATLINVDASLQTATITPTSYSSVIWPNTLLFTVCVNANHTLGAQLQIQLTDSDTGALIGIIPLVYNLRCEAALATAPTVPGEVFVLCGQPVVDKPGR